MAKADPKTDIIKMYTEYPWDDLWRDADILSAIRYVRGAKQLKIPEEWKDSFPTTLPEMDTRDSDYEW